MKVTQGIAAKKKKQELFQLEKMGKKMQHGKDKGTGQGKRKGFVKSGGVM